VKVPFLTNNMAQAIPPILSRDNSTRFRCFFREDAIIEAERSWKF
jgi:hypothetical protein